MTRNIAVLFFLLYTSISFSQIINIRGKVMDSVKKPIFGANVLVKHFDEIITYGISDENGEFSLRLKSGDNYVIKVSYLGFDNFQKKIQKLEKDIYLKISLKESKNLLQEVVINSHVSELIQKKDTIIYNLAALTDGTEQKLKDIITKLPGMTINDNGKVLFNGKRIDKILINGNDFFKNQHQMATENISSDMVKDIEFYTKYNNEFDTRTDSPIKALNIVLKDSYLNRITGNLSLAAGTEKRYKTHINLFYFKKKSNLAFIGDNNNIKKLALSLTDYMELRGGVNNFIKGELTTGNIEIDEETIPTFLLSDRKLKDESVVFGGLNMVYKKPKKIFFNGFYLYNWMQNTKSLFLQREYWTGDIYNEKQYKKGRYLIYNMTNEFKWKINNQNNLYFLLTSNLQKNTGDGDSSYDLKKLNYSQTDEFFNFGTNLKYTWDINDKNSIDFLFFSDYKNNDRNMNLLGNYPVLEDIYLNDSTTFSQLSNTIKENYKFTASYTLFYDNIIGSLIMGGDKTKDKFKLYSSFDELNGNFDLKSTDYFVGTIFKYGFLDLHIKAKLYYHLVNIYACPKTSLQKITYLHPSVNVSYLFNLYHMISVGYYYDKTKYPTSKLLTLNYFKDIEIFNLANDINDYYFPSNHFFLNYNNYLKKIKFYYNLNFSYKWQKNTIDANLEQATDFIQFYKNILTSKINSINFNISLNKAIFKKYYFGFDFNYFDSYKYFYNYQDYSDLRIENKTTIYSKFKKSPINFSLGMKYVITTVSFDNTKNKVLYKTLQPFFNFNGRLKKRVFWQLHTSYQKYNYTGSEYYLNIDTFFEYLLSKRIQVSIIGHNITNLKNYKQIQSIANQNFIEYKRESIMPGYILLKLKYNL